MEFCKHSFHTNPGLEITKSSDCLCLETLSSSHLIPMWKCGGEVQDSSKEWKWGGSLLPHFTPHWSSLVPFSPFFERFRRLTKMPNYKSYTIRKKRLGLQNDQLDRHRSLVPFKALAWSLSLKPGIRVLSLAQTRDIWVPSQIALWDLEILEISSDFVYHFVLKYLKRGWQVCHTT